MTTERILVVDDEETLCEVLRLNLENEGYDVDIALSAEEALKLDIRQYSLILLDIMMGEISGIRFAKMLKSDVGTAGTTTPKRSRPRTASCCGRRSRKTPSRP